MNQPQSEETTGDVFIDCVRAFGIFVGFVLLALLWKALYFGIVRYSGFNIQRWKRIEKMYYWLELHDCLMHNTLANLATQPTATGGQASSQGSLSLFAKGLDLNRYNSHIKHVNGVRTEVESLPKIINVTQQHVRPNEQLKTDNVQWNQLDKTFKAQPKASTNDRYSMGSGDLLRKTQQSQKASRAWSRPSVHEIWTCDSERKVPWYKQMMRKCCGSKKKKWRKMKPEQSSIPHGFSFKGTHWIPRTLEKRSFYKFCRGNLMTLFGSSVSAIIVLIGARLAIQEIGIYFSAALTGGTLFAIATFIKAADYISPIFTYFNLLWSDLVERGDIVEVSSTLSGFCYATGYTLVGCVLDITITHVYILSIKPYSTLGNLIGNDKCLDRQGNLISVNSIHSRVPGKQTTNPHNLTVGTFTTPAATTINMSEPEVNEYGPGDTTYIERDMIKINMVVAIPITQFACNFISKHVSWVPVINLQQVSKH